MTFLTCAELYKAGIAHIPKSSPLYRPSLDRDNDGIACDNPPPWFTPKPLPTVKTPAPTLTVQAVPSKSASPSTSASASVSPSPSTSVSPSSSVTLPASQPAPSAAPAATVGVGNNSPSLPVTGPGIGAVGVTGVLLLAVGATAIVVTRKRRRV